MAKQAAAPQSVEEFFGGLSKSLQQIFDPDAQSTDDIRKSVSGIEDQLTALSKSVGGNGDLSSIAEILTSLHKSVETHSQVLEKVLERLEASETGRMRKSLSGDDFNDANSSRVEKARGGSGSGFDGIVKRMVREGGTAVLT